MVATSLILSILSQTSDQAFDWAQLGQYLLTALGGGFLLLLRHYGKELVAWIAQRTGSAFAAEVSEKALVVVMSLYQSRVKALKKTSKWDDAAKTELLCDAKKHLKMLLDEEKLAKAAGELGVDGLLSHHVEAAVGAAKLAGKAADPTKGSVEP